MIGDMNWFHQTPTFTPRGTVDSVLRLLEQQVITRRKALELIQFATGGRLQDATQTPPQAPWEELNWAPDAVR